jgi:hypothetical protein
LQGQRDFLRRSIHFTNTGVHHQKLDEVPGNPANLNLREAINTKPIRELLLGAKQHQHMSNLPSPILRITHSVANKHVTLLGEDKDVEEMRILAPRIVKKFKIWGCSNATLDPTPIESENMRNPPMSTPRRKERLHHPLTHPPAPHYNQVELPSLRSQRSQPTMTHKLLLHWYKLSMSLLKAKRL